jgi:hypothetical protein
MDIQWLNNTHFQHWPILNAKWIGHFDTKQNRYVQSLLISMYMIRLRVWCQLWQFRHCE